MKKIFILSIFIGFLSCKKEECINESSSIIYPESYYPCYPNSWWEYQIIYINDTIQQLWSVGSNYEPHSYETTNGNFSETALVPFLNGYPIYGYEGIKVGSQGSLSAYEKYTILSENVGAQFTRNGGNASNWGDFSEYLEVTEKIFDGTDSLIILEGNWVWGPKANHRSYQVYKKYIGLTNHYEIDNSNGDTIYKRILTNYFVDL